jgi:hypothetical protein
MTNKFKKGDLVSRIDPNDGIVCDRVLQVSHLDHRNDKIMYIKGWSGWYYTKNFIHYDILDTVVYQELTKQVILD